MIQEYKLLEIYSAKVDYFLLRYDNALPLITSISRIFLNKKIENLKASETIDRYSFERSNLLGGHVENLSSQFCPSKLFLSFF